jgi:hypothetical protein
MEGISGEDADQFGERIFDLSEKGCTFRVRCEKQGDYPTYVSSKFLVPAAIPGLDENRIKEIYDGGYKLDEVFRVKTYDELKAMLDEHLHCIEPGSQETLSETVVQKDPELDEDVPMDFDTKTETTTSDTDEELEDDKVQELLAGLDDV